MKCPQCDTQIPNAPADSCWDYTCGPDLPVECEYGMIVWAECFAVSDTGIEEWSGKHICGCGWRE